MAYVTREPARDTALKVLREMAGTVPGIDKVILPASFGEYGYPTATNQGRMADLVLAAAPGYAFDANTKGETVVDVPPGSTPDFPFSATRAACLAIVAILTPPIWRC